jgi:hypothetical protein
MMNDERTMTEGSMPETASTPVASRPTTVLRALRSGGATTAFESVNGR